MLNKLKLQVKINFATNDVLCTETHVILDVSRIDL